MVEGGSDALTEEVGRRFPFHFFPPLVDQDCPPRYLAVSGLHKKKHKKNAYCPFQEGGQRTNGSSKKKRGEKEKEKTSQVFFVDERVAPIRLTLSLT